MADTIKDAVRIYKIVHSLLHFESSAPQGGAVADGTVSLCQRLRPYHMPYFDKDRKRRQLYGGIYELYVNGGAGVDPIGAMEVWIRNTLLGSAGLAAEVGTRIEPGPLPEGTPLPAVSFQLITPEDVQGAGGVIFATRATYRVCVET